MAKCSHTQMDEAIFPNNKKTAKRPRPSDPSDPSDPTAGAASPPWWSRMDSDLNKLFVGEAQH